MVCNQSGRGLTALACLWGVVTVLTGLCRFEVTEVRNGGDEVQRLGAGGCEE